MTKAHGLTIALVLDVNRPADFTPYAEWHFDRETAKATEREFEDAVEELHDDIEGLFYGD